MILLAFAARRQTGICVRMWQHPNAGSGVVIAEGLDEVAAAVCVGSIDIQLVSASRWRLTMNLKSTKHIPEPAAKAVWSSQKFVVGHFS